MKYLVFIFAIFISQLETYVLALDAENVVGGYPARQGQFGHHVAITCKTIDSDQEKLVGNGAFIGRNLVLTAAQIFVNNIGELRDYEYAIIADSTHWRLVRPVEAFIYTIYLPVHGNYYINNIAVAKLNDDFHVSMYLELNTLGIPDKRYEFYDKSGVVAGYGALLPSDITHNERFGALFEGADIDGFLSYATVQYSQETRCSIGNRLINPEVHFCGKMEPERSDQRWGLCDNDMGTALVYRNMVIGIAGPTNPDCNDVPLGLGYTKVAKFFTFVRSIMDGRMQPGTVTRENRMRVPNRYQRSS